MMFVKPVKQASKKSKKLKKNPVFRNGHPTAFWGGSLKDKK